MSGPKAFPPLDDEQLEAVLEKTLQWSLANGLVMYPPNFSSFSANNAPITLFPTPIPRSAFEKAVAVQKSYNELYANVVSKDVGWLTDKIRQLSVFDETFTGKLYDVYLKSVEANGGKPLQPLSLGIFRSDYMLHESGGIPEIKQIEFNTISVSFGGLASKIPLLHNYLNKSGSYDPQYARQYYDEEELPISDSAERIAWGLASGNFYYNEEADNTKTVVLFVVQPNERNCFDQRHIEYSLLTHGIKSYRLTLEEVTEKTTVNQKKLYIKATMDEVSVVYYRSGYAPSDYDVNPENWNARLHLENTLAIKCPSILTQLAGTKKIQQVLTEESTLRKFLPDAEDDKIKEVLATFVKIYPLDDSEEGQLAKKLVFESPQSYVLKPQREGGGNNVYKEDIPAFLKSIDENEWGAYVLMELIVPPTHKNKLIRNNEIFHEDIISELGIFGTVVFNEETGEIKQNLNSGWLLRSKFSSSNEGGVAAGFGCVDNIYLY